MTTEGFPPEIVDPMDALDAQLSLRPYERRVRDFWRTNGNAKPLPSAACVADFCEIKSPQTVRNAESRLRILGYPIPRREKEHRPRMARAPKGKRGLNWEWKS